MQLFMSIGTSASVTFTPAAGTYRVRAKAGIRRYGSTSAEKVDFGGSVLIAGETTSLGKITLNEDYRLLPRTLTVAFVADGATPVTLTLTCTKSYGMTAADGHLLVDDVELVPVVDNLVRSPGFESDAALKCWGAIPEWNDNYAQRYVARGWHLDSDGANNLPWIIDGVQNSYYLRIRGTGCATQEISFVEAGDYRLSLYARKRVYNGSASTYEANPLRMWLAKDGGTNEISRVIPLSTNFCHYSWSFVLPSAGKWTFGIQGMGGTVAYPGERYSAVDEVSIVREKRVAASQYFPDDLTIDVAPGARLHLGFAGTNRISRLRLGSHGANVSGIVTAERFPDCLSGTGCFEVPPRGTVLILR